MSMKERNLQTLKSYLEDHSPFKKWLQSLEIENLYHQHPEYIIQALTHSSFVHEEQDWEQGHNERLEFLGDAVLDYHLSKLLFVTYPELSEGELSRLRSSLVNEETLCTWAYSLGLPEHILLGRGEAQKENVEKAIVSDCLEALFGAISLIDPIAPKICLKKWIALFDEKNELPFLSLLRLELFDPKSRLQEMTLEKEKVLPVYESISLGEGLGYESTVYIKEKAFEKGRGPSKKKAEIAAARETIVKNYINK